MPHAKQVKTLLLLLQQSAHMLILGVDTPAVEVCRSECTHMHHGCVQLGIYRWILQINVLLFKILKDDFCHLM